MHGLIVTSFSCRRFLSVSSTYVFLFLLFECRAGDFRDFRWFDDDVAFAVVAGVLFPARCLVER